MHRTTCDVWNKLESLNDISVVITARFLLTSSRCNLSSQQASCFHLLSTVSPVSLQVESKRNEDSECLPTCGNYTSFPGAALCVCIVRPHPFSQLQRLAVYPWKPPEFKLLRDDFLICSVICFSSCKHLQTAGLFSVISFKRSLFVCVLIKQK